MTFAGLGAAASAGGAYTATSSAMSTVRIMSARSERSRMSANDKASSLLLKTKMTRETPLRLPDGLSDRDTRGTGRVEVAGLTRRVEDEAHAFVTVA